MCIRDRLSVVPHEFSHFFVVKLAFARSVINEIISELDIKLGEGRRVFEYKPVIVFRTCDKIRKASVKLKSGIAYIA